MLGISVALRVLCFKRYLIKIVKTEAIPDGDFPTL